MIVSEVTSGSSADGGGLQTADMIMAINRKSVRWLKDFELLTRQLGPQENTLLLDRRGPSTIFLSLQNNVP